MQIVTTFKGLTVHTNIDMVAKEKIQKIIGKYGFRPTQVRLRFFKDHASHIVELDFGGGKPMHLSSTGSNFLSAVDSLCNKFSSTLRKYKSKQSRMVRSNFTGFKMIENFKHSYTNRGSSNVDFIDAADVIRLDRIRKHNLQVINH